MTDKIEQRLKEIEERRQNLRYNKLGLHDVQEVLDDELALCKALRRAQLYLEGWMPRPLLLEAEADIERILSAAIYVCRENWGDCYVCGKYDDRRYGVCFDCADHVRTDGAWVWDERDPDRKWPV